MGMSCTTKERLIMSLLNKLRENFSEGKSTIPVVASTVLVLLSTSAFAFDKKMFKENHANVTDKAVVYQTVSGVDAMSITLDYSMKGGEVDWARRGQEGFAQRWQIQLKKSTPANTTAWYTFKFNIAKDTQIPEYTLSFADFKRMIGNTDTGAPPISFSINNNRFMLGLSGSDKQTCKKWKSGSEECNNSEAYFMELADSHGLKGRWVTVTFRVDWSDSGSVAVWIDDKLRAEYYGNLRQGGTGFRYKVGSYRHHMIQATDKGITIEPVTVHYADITSGKSCSTVSESCSTLETQLKNKKYASGMSHIAQCGTGGPASCRTVRW